MEQVEACHFDLVEVGGANPSPATTHQKASPSGGVFFEKKTKNFVKGKKLYTFAPSNRIK